MDLKFLSGDNGGGMPEWMEELMEDVDMESVEMLRKYDGEYQRIMKERAEIQKKFPCIDKLLDGKGGITFSPEAQEAFQEYMRLNCNIDFRERQMYFWSGHIYSYEYLRKVGALKSEKD